MKGNVLHFCTRVSAQYHPYENRVLISVFVYLTETMVAIKKRKKASKSVLFSWLVRSTELASYLGLFRLKNGLALYSTKKK